MSFLEPAVTEEQAVHKRLMQFGEHASLATPLWEARDTSVPRTSPPCGSHRLNGTTGAIRS